jgi:DNA-binding CsgD family transcriptional regulator
VPIDPNTWQQLLDTVYAMNSAGCRASFSEMVVAGLSRIIAADVVVFHVLDPKTQRILTHMVPPNPYTEEEIAYYSAHPGDHPVGAHYFRHPDAPALRISDVIGREEWLASDYYRNCLQRLGLVHSIVLPVKIDQSIVVALSFARRDPDFTREDCELLDAFGPHLRLAWQRHESPWADRRELESRRRLQALGLSPRESEVLFWMTEGKLNREIATLLGLTLGTVQDNVARILEKLGVENRHAATVFAIARLRQP